MISRLFDSKPFVRLFSLLMACVIWLFVKAGNPDAEMTFRGVEINVITQNAQLENAVSVVEMSGQTVDVTLRGGKELLGRITAADIHAAIEFASHILHIGNKPLFFGTKEDYKNSDGCHCFICDGGHDHD